MRIGEKITNPGELRTLITLQAPTVNKDAGGAHKPSWANLTPATVYAKWTNAHGQEIVAAEALQTQAPATVLIRYRSDVTTRVSILKDSQRYDIISVDDVQDRHEYMELKVRLTKGGV